MFIGAARIESTCAAEACSGHAVAVQGLNSKEHGVLFVWLCAEHAKKVEAHRLAPIVELVRTCNADVEGSRCGAVATHVWLVGYRQDGQPHLGITSVCTRHNSSQVTP